MTDHAARHDPTYIDTTIQTVRQHKGAVNSWPFWANALADAVEDERARAEDAEAERDEAHARVRLYLTEVEIVNMRAEAAEARVAELKAALAGRDDALERTASLACYLLNALQPWGLQSPEVRSAATRLTVSLAALTPPSEAAAALAKGDTA